MRGGGGGARQGCLCGSLEHTGHRMATVCVCGGGALWHLPGRKAPYPAVPLPFSGKSTTGCRPNRHGNHPRKRFLLSVGNVLQDGLGWAGERLFSASLTELQMEKLVQVWRHLCVTVRGVV